MASNTLHDLLHDSVGPLPHNQQGALPVIDRQLANFLLLQSGNNHGQANALQKIQCAVPLLGDMVGRNS